MYYYIGGLADSDIRLSLFLSFDFLQATFLYINLSVISAVILNLYDILHFLGSILFLRLDLCLYSYSSNKKINSSVNSENGNNRSER